MKKLLEYLPFHFTLSLIIGITSQFNFRIWSYGFLAMAYVAFALFIILILLRRSKLYFFSVWLFFFCIGVAVVYAQDDRNYSTYYGHHKKDNASAVIAIQKELKSSTYNYKYEATILQLDTTPVRGNILLNLDKDSIEKRLKVGDILFLKPKIEKVSSPLNPHQFDYGSYLEKQGIYHQVFVKNSEYVIMEQRQNSLQTMASEIRNSIEISLRKSIVDKDVLGVMNALLLGQRRDISVGLIESYTKAGAIHILAVSGLHVGILLLIFSYVLGPIERIKNGKFYKTLIVVVLLWMFALIAGLSASVVRAVTMFTFVAFGMMTKRSGGVLNALLSSAFFLLLIKPLFLFDVGFQLSYLAVFGIVWIQPMISNLWKPKYTIVNKLWQLSTVSIAAQAMILPLSLYYFHQFPGLFIISNLVIVPFLGMILLGGILIIFLSLIGVLPHFLVEVYEVTVATMNSFVSWIAAQEQFLITEISFSMMLMIASYFVILSVGSLCSKWHPKKMMVALGTIILFQSVLMYKEYEKNSPKALIVFHKSKRTIIGERLQDSLCIYSDMNLLDLQGDHAVKSYLLGEDVFVYFDERLHNYYQIGNEELLIVDKKGVYEFKGYENAIILLRQSPRINLERLITRLNPKVIIADGSNYKSTVAKWEKTCIEKKTPFWYTGQNGAYILKK
ncbi:ComEC/Rec2 family competence protein [Flavobacteriaceae bacterium S356]|uniref:ComEC/Rec2 family competence protein n=1 Tax=Asprobacillus argus TaxID=3076534 RepID=A0ABU3LF16_9FLAO|nr:ComEC/Rec2 family competence protein [Flavobacteriaceae bacterium S356]